ncbi:hypothetical protein PVAND_010580 [Polypedilum vanderplanki]|uniref:F-box domain-containing protein n=1 Tax=Polypedilum vanderplanki TaxID=319348 RepID=A0A9J6CH06_POLVA|nr:hypothetical protein PVAND_010580 [Polypedilum vanderplanki]
MEQLPTNILVKIFQHLNQPDLISVSKCCKKFNSVIIDFMPSQHPPIRIDFQYLYYNKVQKFTYKDGKDFNSLIDTNRLYQNYIFFNFNKEHTDRLGNKWLQLFKKQINARSIRIKSDCLDLQQLSNMLKLTHRLVFLEIDGYRLAKTNEPLDDSDIANLPSLRHLKIHSFLDTTPQLFKIFQECKNLKTIALSALFMVSKKIKSINEFICNQRSLEQLELIGLDTHNALFQYEQMGEIKYQLKKLNVEYNGYSFNLEKFMEFFSQQKALKEVKLALDLRNSMHHAHDTKLCDEILRNVMTLEHLASFSLLVNKYSLKDVDSFNFCNNCIKKFVFENETRDNNNLLVGLLKSLRKLKHLELACEYSDELLIQLPLLSNLKHLKLTDYYQGLLQSIKCSDTLQSISLKYCYTKNSGPDWHEFLKNHPNIKKIHIDHSIDFIDDAIAELIAGACGEHLEYFVMTDSTAKNLSMDAYKSFQKHCPNLKCLKLTERPSRSTQNKHQSFHDLLANVKCVIFFYIICIIFFIVLILLMIYEKI